VSNYLITYYKNLYSLLDKVILPLPGIASNLLLKKLRFYKATFVAVNAILQMICVITHKIIH